MFVADADNTSLRQGDILEGIAFPRLSRKDLFILGAVQSGESEAAGINLTAAPHVHRDDPEWLTGQVPLRMSFCAVISQCCDLEPRHNRIEIPAFAVARLIPVPKRIVAD